MIKASQKSLESALNPVLESILFSRDLALYAAPSPQLRQLQRILSHHSHTTRHLYLSPSHHDQQLLPCIVPLHIPNSGAGRHFLDCRFRHIVLFWNLPVYGCH